MVVDDEYCNFYITGYFFNLEFSPAYDFLSYIWNEVIWLFLYGRIECEFSEEKG